MIISMGLSSLSFSMIAVAADVIDVDIVIQ
jgi:hypothetical protein